eukprot:4499515-Amphidinium_carterae.3
MQCSTFVLVPGKHEGKDQHKREPKSVQFHESSAHLVCDALVLFVCRAFAPMLNSAWGTVAEVPDLSGSSNDPHTGLGNWEHVAELALVDTTAEQEAEEAVNHTFGEGTVSADIGFQVVSAGAEDGLPGLVGTSQPPPTKRQRGRPKKKTLASHVVVPLRESHGEACSSKSQAVLPGLSHKAHHSYVPTGGAAELLVPTVASYCPVQVNGISLCSVNSSALHACMYQASLDATHMDEDYLKLQQHYIDTHGYHIGSILHKSEAMDMNRRLLIAKLSRLACAQVIADKFARWQLEDLLSRALEPTCLRLYLDIESYDETPMRCTVRELDMSSSTLSLHGPMEDSGVFDLAAAKRLEASLKINSDHCKILQVRQSYGFMVLVGSAYVKFIGVGIVPLSVMERCTANTLLQCLMMNSGVSTHAKEYNMSSRVTCSDKAGYNLLAEKRMRAERGGFAQLFLKCDVHTTATVYSKCLDNLVTFHVSSMIHAALSLQQGANMSLFRMCLKTEIKNRLVFLRGSISEEAKRYKWKVLQLFESIGGADTMVRAMLLSKLANGDWRDGKQVQHIVELDDAEVDAEERKAVLVELIVSALCWVMAAATPKTYPRHRWVGADLAIDHLSKIEGVHKLFTHAYRRFAVACSKPGLQMTASQVVPQGVSGVDVATDSYFLDDEGHAEDIEPQLPGNNTVGAKSGNDSFAEQNSKDREATLLWLGSSPWTHLVLMKMTIAPLAAYMHTQLYLSSEEFELVERAKVAKVLSNPLVAEEPTREFMLTVAASRKHEGIFFEGVKKAFQSELWEIIDADDLNVATRHLAFKLLSRAASLLYQLNDWPHKQFPFVLFKDKLGGKDAFDCLHATPVCVLDKWSQDVRAKFTEWSPEFEHCLHFHAMQAATNIAPIESRHSSIRRFLQSRVHTHNMEVATCSAEWVFLSLRSKKLSQLLLPRKLRTSCNVVKQVIIIKNPKLMKFAEASDCVTR